MIKYTKFIVIVLSVVMILMLCSACSDKKDPVDVSETANTESVVSDIDPVELSKEDKELLEIMASDIIVVDDASFASTVTEMMYHVGEYNGQVFQIEGVFTTQLDEAGNAYVYRNLVNGSETTVAALPIVYLGVDVAEGSWVRVTAVIGTGEINEVQATVLELITIENAEPGIAELTWSGSEHTHSH